MKSGCLTYSLIIVVSLLFLLQCKTSKNKLEKSVPFTVVQATVNDWFGGREGVKGTKLEFHFNNETIDFQKVYFENRVEKLFKRSSSKSTIYTANLSKGTRNINLNSDPKKEYGNTAPKIEIDFPFELEKDECVIVYTINGKEQFYKISLKRLKPVFHP